MAILKTKKDTIQFHDRESFRLTCDCAGEGCSCAQIYLSFWAGDNHRDLVDVTYIPEPYPMRSLWHRIKLAWTLIVHGRWDNYDDMVLNKRSVDSWIEELQAISAKMKGKTQL